MDEWSPDRIRRWILPILYELYMKDPQNHIHFTSKPSDEPEPPINSTIREMQFLEMHGLVEIINDGPGYIFARLTPQGRIYWEKYSSQSEDEPLEFD